MRKSYNNFRKIEANGNYSGDLLHVHQHTGNPNNNTDLVHLESEYAGVLPLHIIGANTSSIVTNGPIQLDLVSSTAPFKLNSNAKNVVTNLIAESASFATSASYSPGGSPATYTSSLFGTASWANNVISASYSITADTASFVSNIGSYRTVTTSSTKWITCSFNDPNQYVNINVVGAYSFTSSNHPTSGQYADLLLHINNTHTVSSTSSLSFPAAWKAIGQAWPTKITGSKSAVVWLRALDTTTVVGTYNVQP